MEYCDTCVEHSEEQGKDYPVTMQATSTVWLHTDSTITLYQCPKCKLARIVADRED